MVINERRVAAKRHCITCKPTRTRPELTEDGYSNCYSCCCAGGPPSSRAANESRLERFPKFFLQRFVLYKPCKVFIILMFIMYMGFSIYGAAHVQQGLRLSDLANEKSYYHKYATLDEKYFATEMFVSFVIDKEMNYSRPETQELISNMISIARNDSFVNGTYTWNWLESFMDSIFYTGKDEDFVLGLEMYLQFRNDLQNDVVIDTEKNTIVAARFHVLTENLKTSNEQADMMLRTREIADESGLPVFSYSAPFIFFEQYVEVLPTTLRTVGIAIVVMVIITTIFMPHPLLVFFVALTMLMILIGVFGFMYFWGLTLSSVTMIHLIMSIGFSVDFSAHICHAYICSEGVCRNSIVCAAIDRSGGPVFNAAVSSILGIMLLVFSTSYIFQSFYKLMFLVIVFGFAHSMFLLPVILSLIGPTLNIVGTSKRENENGSTCIKLHKKGGLNNSGANNLSNGNGMVTNGHAGGLENGGYANEHLDNELSTEKSISIG